jgi:hypothetical protein
MAYNKEGDSAQVFIQWSKKSISSLYTFPKYILSTTKKLLLQEKNESTAT